MKEIRKIVLTGGPSSGKSQSMPHIKEHLEKCGYKVICIDETSTQIINSNIHWRDERVDAMTYQ
ncbi:MAG: AAA family ATPase, partial [Clostridia bacterium]|nr:AAA family ATPase [Clostridia bacterium]